MAETPRPEIIPNPAARRLSFYLRQLEMYQRKGRRTISSKQLGVVLGYTDAQVRKDLAYFGQFGHPGIGYRVEESITRLRQILGTDKTWDVMLVGAGNLGRALLAYHGFDSRGFRIVAVFDSDEAKVGTKFGHFDIHPAAAMPRFIRDKHIRLAILAVPADVAQDVADNLIAAGVRGILNFAPVALIVPPNVALNSVDLAVQLEQISFQVGLTEMTHRKQAMP
jgi:redox-sensing transcriptional repressor